MTDSKYVRIKVYLIAIPKNQQQQQDIKVLELQLCSKMFKKGQKSNQWYFKTQTWTVVSLSNQSNINLRAEQ